MTVAYDLAHRASSQASNHAVALEDRFEVLKEIGDGSFGSVVLARVRSAGASVARRGTVVAIKTMKKTFESFQPCLELREVVFLRTLPTHPHLVPALDIFLDPFTKKLHICMEYMDGNLYQLMKARDHKCLDGASVKSILFQIMQGLEHIHAHHFFHRDIKPENILVSTSAHQDSTSFRRYSAMVTPPSTPPSYTVKIADFGLARETHSKLPYTTYVSTRWYRAPEVLLRAGEYSAPVDIWAVGAMAVEVATLKPLFPGGNEVDQVWRVCEIMGSPGNWYSKSGARVGGGEWKEGIRLASKLGFAFPKMAPHALDTILQQPQWPASLSHFVTWCLMWDPKARPTSTQALAHEYFADATDPLRPRSAASRLGRKQSDLKKDPETSAKSWFRKSLIGRSETPVPALVPGKENVAPRPAPVHAVTVNDIHTSKSYSHLTPNKRSTWSNGPSAMAPMPILPTIKPVSPLSDTVNAQASYESTKKKKIGRQLSVASSTNHYAEMHRQQAERALNGNGGLVSPPSAHKESFFSHLRKRARRFSGRHQTPISPASDDIEAQAGCGPWASNRSSIAWDQSQMASQKMESYEALDRALRAVHDNLESPTPIAPIPPLHSASSTGMLKRHKSLPQHPGTRSTENIAGAARAAAAIPGRTRRSQALQYDVPAEEDELQHEAQALARHAVPAEHSSSDGLPYAAYQTPRDHRQSLRQSASTMAITNPYPTPSPSANGNGVLFGQTAHQAKATDGEGEQTAKWPTPPYEEQEWAAAAAASIWAIGNRI